MSANVLDMAVGRFRSGGGRRCAVGCDAEMDRARGRTTRRFRPARPGGGRNSAYLRLRRRPPIAPVSLSSVSVFLNVARVPHDLEAGQQLDITRRAAGLRHADAFGLVGRGVFGPVLPQRVLRRGFVGETGLLVAPENDGPAPGRLAARPDLERRRAAATTARVYPRDAAPSVCCSPRPTSAGCCPRATSGGRSFRVGCRCPTGACAGATPVVAGAVAGNWAPGRTGLS